MASFKAKFPVLQELFAKNHRGPFGPPPPPPAGRGLNHDELWICYNVQQLSKRRSALDLSFLHGLFNGRVDSTPLAEMFSRPAVLTCLPIRVFLSATLLSSFVCPVP